MIKCPRCGSTAQVQQESGNTYSCGCGCWFTVIQKETQPISKLAYDMIQTLNKMKDK